MGIRLDVVSNRSSRSYIIDKNKFGGELSVEGVFQKMKSFHTEARELYHVMDAYVAEECGLTQKEYTYYYKKDGLAQKGFMYYNKKGERVNLDDFYWEIGEELWEFGIHPVDLLNSFRVGHHINEYETYEDYAADGNNSNYWFSICDYRLDSTEITLATIDTIVHYEVLQNAPYYVMEDALADMRAKAIINHISHKDDDLLREKMLKLGEICIHSPEGRIDSYVSGRLMEICAYKNNRLG